MFGTASTPQNKGFHLQCQEHSVRGTEIHGGAGLRMEGPCWDKQVSLRARYVPRPGRSPEGEKLMVSGASGAQHSVGGPSVVPTKRETLC